MKNIRRAAQFSGMFLILMVAAGQLSGCGNNYAEKTLVTIDSDEMQSIQADLDADQEVESDAEATTAAEPPETADSTNPNTPASGEPVEQTAAVIAAPVDQENPGDISPKDAPADLLPVDPAAGDPTALLPAKPLEVKLLVPDKSFQKVEPDGALRVSYDDLDLIKVLNMDPVTLDAPDLMPKWLKGLDGKRIRLRGFMYPPYSDTENASFVLARDNEICCFGRNPKPYDVIQIVMRKGVTTNYIQNRPFDVVGTFHIELLTYDDKKVDGLYLIDDAIVMDR